VKKTIIALICALSIFFMGLKMLERPRYEIPQSEQSVNKLLSQMSDQLSKKYKLHPIATVVAMPSGVIKQLGLEFQVYGPLSKEEIRKILINSSQELLSAVNDDLKIRPNLECYPFTLKRIEICLFVIDKK